MDNTFPPDRKLGNAEKLRLFSKDRALLKRVSKKLGVNDDEAKRRAVHVGLSRLAELLGVEHTDETKAA